jgi:hypothetical protein
MAGRKPQKKDSSKVEALIAQADARAAEQGIEIEPEEFSLEWYRADWPARKQTFIEHEIKVRNAFHRNQIEPFILNDAQLELLEASNESYHDPSLEDATLKCRRIGATTFYLADYLSDCIMESGHDVRTVAHDPKTLKKFIKVINQMYKGLRDEIRPKPKYDSKHELAFEDEEKGVVDSQLGISNVVPGQEDQGRGDTFTRLHLTEIPFWKGDSDVAATALSEAAKGGKITYESTAKGVGDFFHKKYLQGKRQEGGVRSHFFQWWWNRNYQVEGARFRLENGNWYLGVPKKPLSIDDLVSTYTKEEREKQSLPLQSEKECAEAVLAHLKIKGYVEPDAEWHCDAVAQFVAWRRNEIAKKGARKFRVEYPENDVDCFAATGGCLFADCPTVVSSEVRPAYPGHLYLVVLDPSDGIDGGNPFSLKVLDILTTRIEEVFFEGGIKKQDWQGRRCTEVSSDYNAAEIVVERNKGEASILEIERLGFAHRLYRYIDPDLEREIRDGKITYQEALERARPGLPMTERIKRLATDELEMDWRRGEYRPASPGFVEEAQTFIQNGEKREAKSGYTDDEIMAATIGNYIGKRSRGGMPDFASSGEKIDSAKAGAY